MHTSFYAKNESFFPHTDRIPKIVYILVDAENYNYRFTMCY